MRGTHLGSLDIHLWLRMLPGWQMQALMDVMSRKAFLDALAVYHPFWLSAALEVGSHSES